MTRKDRFDVERGIYIQAAPEVVFSFFVEADKLARWGGRPRQFDPRPGGSYRVLMASGDLAVGQFLEVVPSRRLVFTSGLEGGYGAAAPGSTLVDVTFVARRSGTVVRVVHRSLTERGDDVAHPPTLYAARTTDEPDLLQCEWCARPAQVVPIAVSWPDGVRQLADPVLCAVCAAIFELGPRLHDVEPGGTGHHAAVESRRQQARGTVFDLLAERYAADGRPKPPWMETDARHADG